MLTPALLVVDRCRVVFSGSRIYWVAAKQVKLSCHNGYIEYLIWFPQCSILN